ncbi:MAG: hypothetical protein LLG09_09295 [Negativicutes bacterium]|nr:hypothetical protein [Negativicutes bacterium]
MQRKTSPADLQTTVEGSVFFYRLIRALTTVLECSLAFRLFFKLLGADPANVFVKGIYTVTQYIVGAFDGIFPVTLTTIDALPLLEPATLIAMLVTGIIGMILMRLVRPRRVRPEWVEYPPADLADQSVDYPVKKSLSD